VCLRLFDIESENRHAGETAVAMGLAGISPIAPVEASPTVPIRQTGSFLEVQHAAPFGIFITAVQTRLQEIVSTNRH
jgi:hypothetical protein